MNRCIITILVILWITSTTLFQLEYAKSLDANASSVLFGQEDFWKTFESLVEQAVNETLEEDR